MSQVCGIQAGEERCPDGASPQIIGRPIICASSISWTPSPPGCTVAPWVQSLPIACSLLAIMTDLVCMRTGNSSELILQIIPSLTMDGNALCILSGQVSGVSLEFPFGIEPKFLKVFP